MRTSPLFRVLTCTAVLGLASCNDPTFSTGTDDSGVVGNGSELQIERPSYRIERGQGILLRAIHRTSGKRALDGSLVTWSSSRPDIATVYSNGLVIGTEFGTTEITASYAGAKARASVTVAEVGLSCVAPKGVPQGCPPPPPPPPVLY